MAGLLWFPTCAAVASIVTGVLAGMFALGGYGTMEEMLEMITWAQLGIHKKQEGFIKPGARDVVVYAPNAEELLTKMEQFTPSHQHVAPHESWQMQQLGKYPSQVNVQ